MDKYLIIGLGGFLGANARYLLSGWAAQKWGASFPYGTLLINATGSFILGLFLAATTGRVLVDPRWRLFFAIGFLGAYTTFSTYTYLDFIHSQKVKEQSKLAFSTTRMRGLLCPWTILA